MSRIYQFGHKMQRKSWKSSEIDPESQDRMVGYVIMGVIVFMVLAALFMWWVKKSI